MSLKVWAVSESPDVANEVAAAAAALASSAGARVTVVGFDGTASMLTGDDKLILKGALPIAGSPELAAEALAFASKDAKPDVILVGSTRNGKEIAARVTVKLGTSCMTDLFGISVAEGALRAKRNAFAGRLIADVSIPLPCVATVKAGTYASQPPSAAAGAQKDVGVLSPKARLIERREKPKGTVDLKGAKLIVSAGRGVKKKEDLALINDLASELDGAVGCSRPLSSDMGWLPEEHHIGLTGISVHPDLYLAVGISGQLQHVAGIKDSKIIASINNDKSAPIFEASDYGVVGDLYAVLPAMLKELKARRH
jgi:electron transfer flavoprotein alpha subunit